MQLFFWAHHQPSPQQPDVQTLGKAALLLAECAALPGPWFGHINRQVRALPMHWQCDVLSM